MTADGFRRRALAMPGAIEGAHGGHPDFRVGTRVFATLDYPRPGWAMVKLAPEQQEMVVAAEPTAFSPAKGAWGKRGATLLLLERTDAATVESVIGMAWENATSRNDPRPRYSPDNSRRRRSSSSL
jgi:hypothetical protein